MQADEMKRALALAALLAAACGGPAGPQPTELTPIENPRETRLLWTQTLREVYPYTDAFLNSQPIPEASRFSFFPALVGDAIYTAASRRKTTPRPAGSAGA